MEDAEDFEKFYSSKIQPYLDGLGKEASSAYNWKLFTLFTAIGTFVFFLLNYLKILPSGNILAVTSLLMCIIGVYFTTKYADRFVDDFKEKIIGQIITCIHPQAIYKPMGFVSKKEYKASGLFRRRFTKFDGDDYWQAVYNGIAFHCSEINSWYQDTAGSERIFKGLFFVAGINSSFTGGTYLWSKGDAQLPASIADERYRMYPLPQVKKMKTNHTEFDKTYSVYTSNSDEASLILSCNMIEHILVIKNKLQKDIVFSFVAGKCYIAVPFEEDLLEPSRKGAGNKEEIKKYFYSVLLVFNIINKLELYRLA